MLETLPAERSPSGGLVTYVVGANLSLLAVVGCAYGVTQLIMATGLTEERVTVSVVTVLLAIFIFIVGIFTIRMRYISPRNNADFILGSVVEFRAKNGKILAQGSVATIETVPFIAWGSAPGGGGASIGVGVKLRFPDKSVTVATYAPDLYWEQDASKRMQYIWLMETPDFLKLLQHLKSPLPTQVV